MLEDYNYIMLTKKSEQEIEQVFVVNHDDMLQCYEQINGFKIQQVV